MGPNGDLHKKILRGKHPFEVRFGFAFFGGGRSDCFFVIFCPNGDFHEEMMIGKRPFGARFDFACLWGGVAQIVFLSYLVQTVISMKRL